MTADLMVNPLGVVECQSSVSFRPVEELHRKCCGRAVVVHLDLIPSRTSLVRFWQGVWID